MRTTGMMSEWGISLLTLIGSMRWVVGGTEGTERSARQPHTVRVFTLSRGYRRVDTSYLSIHPILQPPPQTLLTTTTRGTRVTIPGPLFTNPPELLSSNSQILPLTYIFLSSQILATNPMTPLSPTNYTNTRT